MVRTLQGLASELLDGLAEAEKRAAADAETGGREGAVYAITQVCNFVLEAAKRLPDPQAQANMLGRKAILDELTIALIALRYGTVPPILARGDSSNRAPLPPDVLIARGYAAAAVEILHLSGISPEQAAKSVATQIKGRRELSGIKRDDWKAVQKWRYEIKAAKHRPSWDNPASHPMLAADVATFDEMMRQYAQLLAEGKSAVEQRRRFAMLLLDQGRQALSQKGRA